MDSFSVANNFFVVKGEIAEKIEILHLDAVALNV